MQRAREVEQSTEIDANYEVWWLSGLKICQKRAERREVQRLCLSWGVRAPQVIVLCVCLHDWRSLIRTQSVIDWHAPCWLLIMRSEYRAPRTGNLEFRPITHYPLGYNKTKSRCNFIKCLTLVSIVNSVCATHSPHSCSLAPCLSNQTFHNFIENLSINWVICTLKCVWDSPQPPSIASTNQRAGGNKKFCLFKIN